MILEAKSGICKLDRLGLTSPFPVNFASVSAAKPDVSLLVVEVSEDLAAASLAIISGIV